MEKIIPYEANALHPDPTTIENIATKQDRYNMQKEQDKDPKHSKKLNSGKHTKSFQKSNTKTLNCNNMPDNSLDYTSRTKVYSFANSMHMMAKATTTTHHSQTPQGLGL